MTKRPVTVEQSRWQPTGEPGQGEVSRLVPACHPEAGLDLYYVGQGEIRVGCHGCAAPVALLVLHGWALPLRPGQGD